MNILKILLTISLLASLSACSQKKDVSDCEEGSSSGGLFQDTKYDCPTGNPSNDDIRLDSSNYLIGVIEAGFTVDRVINITNAGEAKIFDFKVDAINAEIIENNCPAKLFPSASCAIKIHINDTVAGNKTGDIVFSDKTGNINKAVPFEYSVLPSYPVNKELLFEANEFISFDKMKVNVGPLVDRFGNIIDDPIKVTTNRLISETNTAFQADPLVGELDVNGYYTYYVSSNNLQQSQLVDSAEVTMKLERTYTDPSVGEIKGTFSVSFLNNKPRISAQQQTFNVNEDDIKVRLTNLFQGEDYRGLPVSYKLTTPPANGIISDCLVGNDFITLVNCVYTPRPNFNGVDSFRYKAWNGESLSFEEANVVINVSPINDAPIINGTEISVVVQENTVSQILLPLGFDVDGDSLSYIITSAPTKGTFSCNGRICEYKGNANLADSNDYLIYKVADPSGLESNTFRVNIKIQDINEKPLLGGNETHSTVEDTPFTFTVQAGTDPDANDSLIYRLKNPPNKGKLEGCLGDTQNRTCTYSPNKNVDSADSFTYVAVDRSGLESDPRNVTITISPVNDAPIFSNLYQEVQTLPNNPINFTILSAIDPEGTTVTYSFEVHPTKGNVNAGCMTGLSCTYTPQSGVTSGYDEFKYKAADSTGMISQVRTVRVIIGSTKTAPTLSGVINLNVDEDESIDFELIKGSDIDTPQSFLTYTFASIRPQNGVVKNCMDLEGSSGVNDVSCTYFPNKDFVGTDTFTYLAMDGSGLSSPEITVNFTVNQTNDAPFFENKIHNIVIDEDTPYSLTLIQAEDLESDPLTYSLKTPPSHATIEGDCFTNVNATCTYLLEANFYGEDSFVVEVFDPMGLKDEMTYKVTVNNINDAPVLNQSLLAFVVQEDTMSSINLRAATDIDSNVRDIYYRIDEQPTKGILSNCLGIGGVEGLECKYMTKSNEIGVERFTYKAFDGQSSSQSLEVLISIQDVNDLPYFNQTIAGPFRVENSIPYTFSLITGSDLENESLTYELVTPPVKGTLSNCFGVNGISSCSYTADSDETGSDVIVYRAKDSINNSFNEVQVTFLIEEAKFARVFKLKTNTTVNKPDSISLDDTIYKVGNSYVFNNTVNSLNNILRRNIDKSESNISGRLLTNRSILVNDELFSFETINSNNVLRVISPEGTSNVPMNITNVLNNPMEFNSNIYWGSAQSTLYRLNLTKIGNNKRYYVDKAITKDTLSITSNNSNVIPIASFNGDLFFRYQNESSQWLVAKMDATGVVEKISNIKGKVFSGFKQAIVYDNGTNIKRVFFLVNELEGQQRIYVYDYLQSNINDRFYEITANKTLQETLGNMSLFRGKAQDYILFKDSKSSKAVYLRPDLLIVNFVSDDIVDSITVSKDQTRVALKVGSSLKVTDDSFSLGMKTVSFPSGINIVDSFFGNRFFVKQANGTYAVVNDSLLVSSVNTPFDFNYTGKKSVYENEAMLVSSNGSFESVFVYRDNFIYNISSSSPTSYIDGIVGSSTLITNNPNKVTISNCLGQGSGIAGECKLTLNSGAFGQDSFQYRGTINSIQNEFVVDINIKNEKPKELVGFDLRNSLASISHEFDEILDYTAVKDEFYVSVKDTDSKYRVFKIARNSFVQIYESTEALTKLKSKDNYLFFVDSKVPQKVIRYDQLAGETETAFSDPVGISTTIGDYHLDNNFNFYLLRNYGNPARDRIVKQDSGNLSFQDSATPSALVSGKFFPVDGGLFVVSSTSFARFDTTSNTFVGTQNSTRTIYPELSSSIDKFLVLFVNNPNNALEYNVRVFDTQAGIYDEQTNLFSRERILKNNFEFIKNEVIRLGNNSPYIYFSEVYQNNNGNILSDISVNEKDKLQGSSTSLSNLFEVIGQNVSKLKKVNGEYYFISQNENENQITFHKLGYRYHAIGKYNSVGSITIPRFVDSDSITYSILTSPSSGTLSNCIGMNGSSSSDLICDYSHVGNSITDSFVVRASDGKEFSEQKTINIEIINTRPMFISPLSMVKEGYKNVNVNIDLDIAVDAELNPLYYVVDILPSHGSLSGCNLSEVSMTNSKRCTYIPNNNFTGNDQFSYYVTDGNKRTIVSKVVNVIVNNTNTPVFLDTVGVTFVNKDDSSIIIKLPIAYDPNGQPLSYSTLISPTLGTLSNCYVSQGDYLTCTYTPNNPSQRGVDSFVYIATNGSSTSPEITVNIKMTGSNLTEGLGDFLLNTWGPKLVKNGVNSLSSLSGKVGYKWDSSAKVLTLPSDQYEFNSFIVEEGMTVEFIPVDSFGERSTETKFVEIYARGSCKIDGAILAKGGYTPNPTQDVFLTKEEKDGLTIEHLIPLYRMHGLGGRNGGSSSIQVPQLSDYGTPTYFRGAEGQLPIGSSASTNFGGNRGFDGAPLLIKCLDDISGFGRISVKGDDGENGNPGLSGGRNDSASVSYGGGGGSAGGNGGHSGSITIISESNLFNGDIIVSGGFGGSVGHGGSPDLIYVNPFLPKEGSDGNPGFAGESGICTYIDLYNITSYCSGVE